MSTTAEENILCVLSEDGDRAFDMPFTKNTTIAQLSKAIHQYCNTQLSHLKPHQLKLHLVSVGVTVDDVDITGTRTVPEGSMAMAKVRWTLQRFIGDKDVNTVYVFVEFSPPPQAGERPSKKAKTEVHSDNAYKNRIKKIPSPSDVAKNWKQNSNNPTYLDHRPASATGIPTELLHPVFGEFFDDCRDSNPTPEDYLFVNRLRIEMCNFPLTEAERAGAARDLFNEYFGCFLRCVGLDGSTSMTDGTWFLKQFIALNLEVTKECGSSGNPHVQNQTFYLQYILLNWDTFSTTTRLPCFLLQLHGTELSIYMVIFADLITVDPYHFTLSLSCASTRLEEFARIFHALKKALESLRVYYNNPLPEITPKERKFPYHNSFELITTSINIEFTYYKPLDPYQLLFLVDINENKEGLPSRLLVKFSQHYNGTIHKECGDLGIAPKLYGIESLAGGWHMVVMEYMTGYQTLQEIRPDVEIRDKVKNAIEKLHSRGYVHGDIRKVNVMARREHSESLLHVVLIDWDWAGRDGMVNYPISINPEIPRHPDAMGLRSIKKEHDVFMVEAMFSGLEV